MAKKQKTKVTGAKTSKISSKRGSSTSAGRLGFSEKTDMNYGFSLSGATSSTNSNSGRPVNGRPVSGLAAAKRLRKTGFAGTPQNPSAEMYGAGKAAEKLGEDTSTIPMKKITVRSLKTNTSMGSMRPRPMPKPKPSKTGTVKITTSKKSTTTNRRKSKK